MFVSCKPVSASISQKVISARISKTCTLNFSSSKMQLFIFGSKCDFCLLLLFFFNIYLFLFIYLVAPGLSCGRQAPQLRLQGSFSCGLPAPQLQRVGSLVGGTWAPQLWHANSQLQHVNSQLQHACGIQFPDEGSNPGPLHWEHGVLSTAPPGKSLSPYS